MRFRMLTLYASALAGVFAISYAVSQTRAACYYLSGNKCNVTETSCPTTTDGSACRGNFSVTQNEVLETVQGDDDLFEMFTFITGDVSKPCSTTYSCDMTTSDPELPPECGPVGSAIYGAYTDEDTLDTDCTG